MELTETLGVSTLRQLFIIDTDSYAGNFERNLSLFLVGDFDHQEEDTDELIERKGEEFVSALTSKLLFSTQDEGLFPKCSQLVKSPVKPEEYNSFGLAFKDRPTLEEIAFLKERANEFALSRELNIIGFRVLSVNFQLFYHRN